MHFSFLRNPSASSTTLNGRQSSLATSRPTIPPRVYRIRSSMSLRKPMFSPVCCNVSGALGASGAPPTSQSSWLIFWLSMVEAPPPQLLLNQDEQRQAHDDDAELDDAGPVVQAGEVRADPGGPELVR